PSASFLLMMEAAISGMDSTVPVTSRRAYRRRSAGARPGPGRRGLLPRGPVPDRPPVAPARTAGRAPHGTPGLVRDRLRRGQSGTAGPVAGRDAGHRGRRGARRAAGLSVAADRRPRTRAWARWSASTVVVAGLLSLLMCVAAFVGIASAA